MRDEQISILYLEDDEDNIEMVTFMLELSGMRVTAVRESKDAARLARENSFDLFLLDGLLACGTSLDLCKYLRSLSPATPVVFYSALVFPDDVKNGLEAGAEAYIKKPYSGDLAEAVLNVVHGARTRSAPVPAKILQPTTFHHQNQIQ